jgi:hypothetical protein
VRIIDEAELDTRGERKSEPWRAGIGSDAVWLYLPEYCLSVPVSAASTLPRESHFQRLARSAWWRGKRLRPESWRRAWPKAAFMTRLSGVTLKPSTAARGVASWIRSLQASPVNRIPLQENGREPQTNATSGPTPCESSEKCGPVTSSSRTSQASLGTCPKGLSLICSGTGGECLDRFCLRPQRLELRTEGSGCSSWPTPMHQDSKRTGDDSTTADKELLVHAAERRWPSPRSEDSEACGNHPGATDSLTGATKQWATPNVPNRGAERKEDKRPESGGEDLQTQAMWLTPHGMAGMDATGKPGAGGEFAKQASQWTTPQVSEPDSAPRPSRAATGRTTEYLGRQVMNAWPTPRASEEHQGHETEAAYATGDGYKDCGRGATLSTVTAAFSPPAPQAATGQQSSETPPGSPPRSAKRRLNPYFVEWLQGMPAGWTSPTALIDCAAWETWLCLCRERLRLLCSCGG